MGSDGSRGGAGQNARRPMVATAEDHGVVLCGCHACHTPS